MIEPPTRSDNESYLSIEGSTSWHHASRLVAGTRVIDRDNGRVVPFPVLHSQHLQISSAWVRWFKRPIDFVSALVLVVLLSPFFLALAVLIKRSSPGPVFFRQIRVGQHGRNFHIWKFRTMVSDAELLLLKNSELGVLHGREWKLRNDPRVTPIGQFLRKSSIDELPQLLNVIMGQMSLIGPRPVQQKELVTQYGVLAPVVNSVRPGMTGLWQVSGRSLLSYEERIALDIQYVTQQSLRADLQIAVKTVPALIRGPGAF